VDYVSEEFKAKHGSDPRESPAALHLLRHDSDTAKVALSENKVATVAVRHDGKSVIVQITREQFEDMTADLMQRTIDTAQLVLEQAEVTMEQLDAIVLVGGSTLMPRVPQLLEQTLGKKPYQGLSPHTAVAQGAAIHAAILEAKFRGQSSGMADRIRKLLSNVKQEDVNSHGLGVAARNPKTGKTVNHVMIPRNTRLPAEVHRTFATSEPNQQRVNIRVIEGDAPDPDACSLLGNCRITGLPENLPKGSPIEVVYAFDASGRVRVRAEDKTGGKAAEIEIERRGGLSANQLADFTALANSYRVD
jgi:molecular chaperone DnaK